METLIRRELLGTSRDTMFHFSRWVAASGSMAWMFGLRWHLGETGRTREFVTGQVRPGDAA